MNHIAIIGNITADLQTKQVGQSSVCEFSIAVNEVYYDANKKKIEKVHFFDCSAWGNTGDNIAKFFIKGQKIAIVGTLKQDRWEKDGEKRSKVVIRVDSFDFCGDGGKRDEPAPRTTTARTLAKDPDLDAPEDDIPY